MSVKKTTKTPYSPGCKLEVIIGQQLFTNAFELYIYKDAQSMRGGMKKWVKQNNLKDNHPDIDLMGVVFERSASKEITIDGDNYALFAAMFLNEKDLTMEIISHECVHAAISLDRKVFRFVGMYDGGDYSGVSDEERLAYNIGSFVDKVIKAALSVGLKVKFIEETE